MQNGERKTVSNLGLSISLHRAISMSIDKIGLCGANFLDYFLICTGLYILKINKPLYNIYTWGYANNFYMFIFQHLQKISITFSRGHIILYKINLFNVSGRVLLGNI